MPIRIIIMFLLICFGYANAQNNERVPSKEEKKKVFLGKKEQFKNTSTKAYNSEEQTELDNLDADLRSVDSESYEYNLVHYVNGNYDLTREENLLKAYALRPDEKEVQLEMFGYYLLKGDKANQEKFAGIIQYYYSDLQYSFYSQLLNNKQKVAIITSGQDDSYPLYVLQLLQKEGKEVMVINLDFLQNENYKNNICKILEVENEPFLGNEKAFIKMLVYNQKYPAYISTTVHQNYCSHIANQLYLSGLFYANNASSQYESLVNFWKEVKEQNLTGTTFKTNTEKNLYKNYLPPLLTLYKLKKGRGTRDQELRDGTLALALKLGIKKEVETILNQYDAE